MRMTLIGLLFFAVIAIALPLVLGGGGVTYLLGLITIWAIAAIGYDLVFGLSGMMSFGHAAFFGVGAYALAILTMRLGLPFSVSLIAGAMIGALLALIFGKIALRARGVYFALITLALAELINILASVRLRALTGGTDGIAGVPRPAPIAGFDLSSDAGYVAFVGVIFSMALAMAALLRASPFGHVLRASRQNEVRAEQLGWNVANYRLAVFAISGAYAGTAGGLLAGLMSFVGPDTINWTTSGDLVIMTILGGRDSVFGPVLGVAAMELLREVASSYTEHWHGVLGVIFILCTLFMPEGLAGLVRRVQQTERGR